MPIIASSSAPQFVLPGLTVTGLAAPSRGARETCVWRLALAANTPGTPHTVDREEIFVVLAGRAVATVGGVSSELAPGDALIVPAQESFSLANPHAEVFEAIAVLPVGGLAAMPSGAPFSPPWTT
ncbi:MAG TPA: cupin domain-containing protein [Kofleriaceae bacterium]|jgi:mannose-6-phosphate isomerase-like protein (cupin superfamily)